MEETKTYKTKQIILRIFVFLRPYSLWIAANIAAAITGAASGIYWAYTLQVLTDAALNNNQNGIRTGLYMIGIIAVVSIFMTYAGEYLSRLYAVHTLRDIRSKVFRHIENVMVGRLETINSGDVISRMTNDVGMLMGFIGVGPGTMANILIMAIGAFTYMLFINWKLLLLCIFILPAALYAANMLSKPVKKYAENMLEHMGEMNSIVGDSIHGLHVIKSFNLHNVFLKKYKNSVIKALGESLKIDKKYSWTAPINMVVQVLPLLLCVTYGGALTIKGELTVGELLAVLNLLGMITGSVAMLPGLLNQLSAASSAAGRILEILDFPVEVDGKTDDKTSNINQAIEEAVEFNNVAFSYGSGSKALDGVSFKLCKGRLVALTGASGSGKSTILKLLCGFYKPAKGHIRLYGRDLNEYEPSIYREHLAVVFQDNMLFPGTISENIAFGNSSASTAEIHEAAGAADAHDFITCLPDGYDTVLGENGSGLSAGQGRRIAIARAILKNTRIIIMDEPVSALDAQSGNAISNILKILAENHAVFVITHHPDVLKLADEIIMLDKGRIIQIGTHEQLIEDCGIYRQLFYKWQEHVSISEERDGDCLYV